MHIFGACIQECSRSSVLQARPLTHDLTKNLVEVLGYQVRLAARLHCDVLRTLSNEPAMCNGTQEIDCGSLYNAMGSFGLAISWTWWLLVKRDRPQQSRQSPCLDFLCLAPWHVFFLLSCRNYRSVGDPALSWSGGAFVCPQIVCDEDSGCQSCASVRKRHRLLVYRCKSYQVPPPSKFITFVGVVLGFQCCAQLCQCQVSFHKHPCTPHRCTSNKPSTVHRALTVVSHRTVLFEKDRRRPD